MARKSKILKLRKQQIPVYLVESFFVIYEAHLTFLIHNNSFIDVVEKAFSCCNSTSSSPKTKLRVGEYLELLGPFQNTTV